MPFYSLLPWPERFPICSVFLSPWTVDFTFLFPYTEIKYSFVRMYSIFYRPGVFFLWLAIIGNIWSNLVTLKYLEMEIGDHRDAQGFFSFNHIGGILNMCLGAGATNHLHMASRKLDVDWLWQPQVAPSCGHTFQHGIMCTSHLRVASFPAPRHRDNAQTFAGTT